MPILGMPGQPRPGSAGDEEIRERIFRSVQQDYVKNRHEYLVGDDERQRFMDDAGIGQNDGDDELEFEMWTAPRSRLEQIRTERQRGNQNKIIKPPVDERSLLQKSLDGFKHFTEDLGTELGEGALELLPFGGHLQSPSRQAAREIVTSADHPIEPLTRPGVPPQSQANPEAMRQWNQDFQRELGTLLPFGGHLTGQTPDRPGSLRPAPRQPEDLPALQKGIGRGTAHTIATMIGGAAAVADAVGADELAHGWMQTYDQLTRDSEGLAGVPFEEALDSPGQFLGWAAGALGEQIPVLTSMAVSGGITGVLSQLAARGLLKRGMKEAVNQAAQKWAARGALGGTAVTMSAQEAGAIYGEQREAGLETHPKLALAGGAVNGVLESLVPFGIAKGMGLGGRFTNRVMEELGKRGVMTRILAWAGGASAGEALTEELQEEVAIAARVAIDDSYAWSGSEANARRLQSAATGALVGGILGGVGGVRGPQQTEAAETQSPVAEAPVDPTVELTATRPVTPQPVMAEAPELDPVASPPIPLDPTTPQPLHQPVPLYNLPEGGVVPPSRPPTLEQEVAAIPDQDILSAIGVAPAKAAPPKLIKQPKPEAPVATETMPSPLPLGVHKDPEPTLDPITTPRFKLPRQESNDLYLRGLFAQETMGMAGNERGFRNYDDQGRPIEGQGSKSPTAQWYKDVTKGPGALSRKQVESAVKKIVEGTPSSEGEGKDTGKGVERVKEALLRDPEYQEWLSSQGANTPEAQEQMATEVWEEPAPYQVEQEEAPPAGPEHTDGQSLEDKLEDIAQAARARMKKRGVRMMSGLPVDDMADMAVYGAAKLAKGGVQFARWSAEMIQQFGEAIRPHLQRLFQLSQDVFAQSGGDERKMREFTHQLRKSLQQAQGDAPKAAQQQTELFSGSETMQVGSRPIIAREVAPGEAPLFSKAAQEEEPEQGTLFEPVSEYQASQIQMEGHIPDTPELREAVEKTPDAEFTNGGIKLKVLRRQNPDQADQPSLRTGVFYLPSEKDPNKKHYTGSRSYGGQQTITGTTLIRKPIVVKAGTGGNGPKIAYDMIKGKGSYEAMRSDALKTLPNYFERESPGATIQKIEAFLETYGGEPSLADQIFENSKRGNQLPYALQENVVAGAVREAGYDAVLSYSKNKNGFFLSELFDVREVNYPSHNQEAEIHARFRTAGQESDKIFEPTYEVRHGIDKPTATRLGKEALQELDQSGTNARGLAGDVYPTAPVPGGSGARTLGRAFHDALIQHGWVDLRGHTVRSAEDLAHLAQVYRNPKFETLRLFYVKDGKIVAHEGFTSRMPGFAAFARGAEQHLRTREDIKRRMQRLGADGFWMLHNHPSGEPYPSTHDVAFTKYLQQHLPGFHGHVVINSEKFAVIDKAGKRHVYQLQEADHLLTPDLPHALLNQDIEGPKDLVRLGQQLNTNPNFVSLIYEDSNGKVRAIQEIPAKLFQHPTEGPNYIRARAKAFGSRFVLAHYQGPDGQVGQAGTAYVQSGVLGDFVTEGEKTVRDQGVNPPDTDQELGQTLESYPRYRVGEEQKPYETKPMVPLSLFLDLERQGPLPKYAASVNLQRLGETSEEMKAEILRMSEGLKKPATTFKEVMDDADALGMTVDDTEKFRDQYVDNVAKIVAVRNVHEATTRQMKQARQAYLDDPNPDTYQALAVALNQHLEAFQARSDIAHEAGLALAVHRLQSYDHLGKGKIQALIDKALNELRGKEPNGQLPAEVVEWYSRLNLEDTKEVQQFMLEVGTRTSTLQDKLFEAFISSILSGPKTHMVNTTSNLFNQVLRPMEQAFTGAIDPVLAKLEKREQERFIGEGVRTAYGYLQALPEALTVALSSFRTEVPSSGEIRLDVRRPMQRAAIPGKAGKLIRTPLRFLLAADEFSKAMLRRGALHQLAFRAGKKKKLTGKNLELFIAAYLENPPLEGQQAAAEQAADATFQKELGEFGKWILRGRRDFPTLAYLMPFITTPTNIIKYGLKRSPLNAFRVGYKLSQGELKGGELSDETARTVLGSAIAMTLATFVTEGLVTGGGPDDWQEKQRLYDVNWQPYSIKIGDKYYQYGRIEPLGMMIGLTASFVETMDRATEQEQKKVAEAIVKAFSDNLLSKTWAWGLTTAMEAIRSGRIDKIDRWLSSYPLAAVPNVSAQIARAKDPYFREVQTLMDRYKARIPGKMGSESLYPQRTVFGDPKQRPGSFWSRLFFPGQISEGKPGTEEKALADYRVRIGELRPWLTKDGKRVDIPPKVFDQFQVRAGKLARREVQRVLRSGKFRGTRDFEKRQDLLKDAIIRARRSERNRLRQGVLPRTPTRKPTGPARPPALPLQPTGARAGSPPSGLPVGF